jgi:hypothetical protein
MGDGGWRIRDEDGGQRRGMSGTWGFFSKPFSLKQPRLKGLRTGASVPPLVSVGKTNLN